MCMCVCVCVCVCVHARVCTRVCVCDSKHKQSQNAHTWTYICCDNRCTPPSKTSHTHTWGIYSTVQEFGLEQTLLIHVYTDHTAMESYGVKQQWSTHSYMFLSHTKAPSPMTLPAAYRFGYLLCSTVKSIKYGITIHQYFHLPDLWGERHTSPQKDTVLANGLRLPSLCSQPWRQNYKHHMLFSHFTKVLRILADSEPFQCDCPWQGTLTRSIELPVFGTHLLVGIGCAHNISLSL